MVIVIESIGNVEKKGRELIELIPEALEPIIRKSEKIVVRLYKFAPLPFAGSTGKNYVERVLRSADVSGLREILREMIEEFERNIGSLDDTYLYLEMHYNANPPIFAILCLSKLCPEVNGKKALLYLDTFSWKDGERVVSDLEASLRARNVSIEEVRRVFCEFKEKLKRLYEIKR